MLLEGKVALITGSVRGTGAGIARVFSQAGACIVLNQVQDEGNPQKVLEEIESAGGKAIFVKADITDEVQVREMVAKAEHAFGTIDILVSNYAAGIPGKSPSCLDVNPRWCSQLRISDGQVFLYRGRTTHR